MQDRQRRKREEKQNRVVDSDKSSDSEDSSKAAKHSSLIDDIPSGTQLMLDNQEAKSKMKELERLFELKRQAMIYHLRCVHVNCFKSVIFRHLLRAFRSMNRKHER